MPIIDTQHHEIGPWGDWTKESEVLQQRIITELTLAYLDALGVDGAVLVPVGADDLVAAAAAAVPERLAYTTLVTPETPNLDQWVAAAKRKPGLVGLRVVIAWPPDGSEARRLEQGGWDEVLAACERHAMPVFLFVSGWLPLVARIAETFPDLVLVVDHLGLRQPPLDTPTTPPFADLDRLLALSRFANVNIKLCGLPSLSHQGYPYRDVEFALKAMKDHFGAPRLLWASDANRFAGRTGLERFAHPATAGHYAGKHFYADSYHFIRDSEVLEEAEKQLILGGTASRILNWSPGKPG